MKKFGKILAMVATAALALVLGAIALAGCGVSGENYTYEAEEAELGGAAQVENNKHFWTGKLDEPGDELTQVGYMTAEGSTITFTVNAEKACKVEINIRAASATMSNGLFGGDGSYSVKEIDLSKQKAFKLTVNDEEVAVKGKLPASYSCTAEDFDWSLMMNLFDSPLCNYTDIKVTANLKKGANTIVITATGYTEEEIAYGANFDKIIIKSPAKLS